MVEICDRLLVVDIEATCWRRTPPVGMINEIIEVGVCVLDLESLSPEDKASILIRPVHSAVSAFCTKLTGLKPEDVAGGTSFEAACKLLRDRYDAASIPWCSWGNYDRTMFQEHCSLFDVPYPFHERHINIKKLFADQINEQKPVGLMRAVKTLGMEPMGRQHRGDDDAWNAARVMACLIGQFGLKALLNDSEGVTGK